MRLIAHTATGPDPRRPAERDKASQVRLGARLLKMLLYLLLIAVPRSVVATTGGNQEIPRQSIGKYHTDPWS